MFLGTGETILELERVSHRYDKTDVIRDVSFRIGAGARVAVVGPSGVGKTTLLAIAGLLLRPDRGSVSYFGRSVNSEREATKLRRSSIAWVLQSTNILGDLTVHENVALGLVGKGEGVGEALVHSLPHLEAVGLEGIRNKRARLASGGERQRIGVARAISVDSPLVLADEPTASLDREHVHDVVALLTEFLPSTSALVLATHDKRCWRMCDTVLTLSEGEIQAHE